MSATGGRVRARTVYGWLAFGLLAICLLWVPAMHALVVREQAKTRALAESGRVVTVENVEDVRVSVQSSRSQRYVSNVGVRIDGTWVWLSGFDEDQPDSTRHWYTRGGLQPPMPGTRAYPPLEVRYVPGAPNAATVEDHEHRVANLVDTRWFWLADAMAAAVAVLMVLFVRHRVRRWNQRRIQDTNQRRRP